MTHDIKRLLRLNLELEAALRIIAERETPDTIEYLLEKYNALDKAVKDEFCFVVDTDPVPTPIADDGVEPSEPEEPDEHIEPVEQDTPVEQPKHVEHIEPVEQDTPVEQPKHVEHIEPVEQDTPVEQPKPVEHIEPVEPVEQDAPVEQLESDENIESIESVERSEQVDVIETIDNVDNVDNADNDETIDNAETIDNVDTTPTAAHQPTVNERQQSERRVSDMISAKNASDLARAFTINEKIGFIRGLFCEDRSDFEYTINQLSQFESLDEAYDYLLNELGWDIENDEVKAFLTIVTNHFNAN